MYIQEVESLPDAPFLPMPPSMAVAIRRIMEGLGIEGGVGLQCKNPFDWSVTFVGQPPRVEDVVLVAELHGYDVVDYTDPQHRRPEWDLWCRAITARDPEVLQEYRRSYECGEYDRVT